MHPQLFKILGVQLTAYPFFMAMAGIVVISGSYYWARKKELPRSALLVLTLSGISAFIGARILHGLINFGYYASHPWRWLSFDSQGFSILGGIIFALLIGIAVSKILKIDYWKLGDITALFLGLGIALMRIGCFLNGCCFGKETNLPWGVKFPLLSLAHRYQLSQDASHFFSVLPVHPAQIYELIAALVGSLIVYFCIKKKFPAGTAILSFGIWFSAFRWVNYYWRVSPATFDAPAYFYPVLYGLIIALCATLLYYKLHKRNKSD